MDIRVPQQKYSELEINMKNSGIRSGAEYLHGLRDDREVWTRGARVKDVTIEPGIKGGAAALASF